MISQPPYPIPQLASLAGIIIHITPFQRVVLVCKSNNKIIHFFRCTPTWPCCFWTRWSPWSSWPGSTSRSTAPCADFTRWGILQLYLTNLNLTLINIQLTGCCQGEQQCLERQWLRVQGRHLQVWQIFKVRISKNGWYIRSIVGHFGAMCLLHFGPYN